MELTIKQFISWLPDVWGFNGEVEVRDVCFGNQIIFSGAWIDIPDYLKLRKCSVVCKRFRCGRNYDLIFYV